MNLDLILKSDSIDQAVSVEPLCVPPQMTVRDVMVLMKQHNKGSALVCRDGALAGIFTERDVLRLLAVEGDLALPIEKVMAANPVTLTKADTLATAIRKMTAGGYRRLPVIDDQRRPVGLVKVSAIVHYLVEHFPKTVYNLPPEPRVVAQEREGA